MAGNDNRSSKYWLISNLILYVMVFSFGIWVFLHAAALDASGEFNGWLKVLLLILTVNIFGTIQIFTRSRKGKF